MGPDSVTLPRRPKFTWDLKSAPWTDGKGSQEGYYDAVVLWKQFHDLLPDSNHNKIPTTLQGVFLKSHLHGRALDVVKKLDDATITGSDGAMSIAKAIHKQDPLSVITDTFQKFQDVLKTLQGDSETFKNFESRFDAQISRFHSCSDSAKLPSALVAFLLLANSRIDSSQRVSILASAAPKSDALSDVANLLQSITYDDIASVLRACDKPRVAQSSPHTTDYNSLHANSISTPFRGNPRRSNKRLPPAELAALKKRSTCTSCNAIGHWACDAVCPNFKNRNPRRNRHPRDTNMGHQPNQQNGGHEKDAPGGGSLHFNMAHISDPVETKVASPGPLLDDGAPYSGLGIVELRALAQSIVPGWNGSLDPLPDHIKDRPFWQYGKGSHASMRRRIVGSILLSAISDLRNTVHIRHLVIDGSSQWVIGRNVTKLCNIVHINGNYLQLPCEAMETPRDRLSLIDEGEHSYLPVQRFIHYNSSVCDTIITSLCSHTANTTIQHRAWSDIKKIVDRVHKHVCGHSNFADIKLLLERNHIWTNDCAKYLSSILDNCKDCHAVKNPVGTRPVSLSNMSRQFNELVCVDHLFINSMNIFHIMDALTRFSVGAITSTVTMKEAISLFETLWISRFWSPSSVQGDQAFANEIFTTYLDSNCISFRPIGARRHNKNVLESKHKVLRDIYLRLESAEPDADPHLLVARMFRIGNDLYGNDVASSYELATGYTRPIDSAPPQAIPKEVVDAHNEIIAKRKLNLILRSKSVQSPSVQIGDIVEVFIHHANHKRGTWSQAKPVLSYDRSANIVTVPGAHGKHIKACVEDVRHAIGENELAIQLQRASDVCNWSLDNCICELDDSTHSLPSPDDFDVDDDSHDLQYSTLPLDTSVIQQSVGEDGNGGNGDDHLHSPTPSVVGTHLTHYPADRPEPQSSHRMTLRSHTQPSPQPVPSTNIATAPHEPSPNSSSENTTHMNAHEIELLPGTSLSTTEQHSLGLYHDRFGPKEFLKYQAEGLPDHIIENSYSEEEENFLMTCSRIPVSKIPSDANIITSHVLYKVKDLDDGSRRCKARIAPHGNKDRDKHKLRSDSSSCPPLGFRILLSVCSIFHWYISKVDVKSAFLQSGTVTRDIYVVPPKESDDRSVYWLLHAATYGLVNANVKWQLHSDTTFLDMGLRAVVYIPQLFYLLRGNSLVLIVAKVVDDILIGGPPDVRREFVQRLSSVYKLGTIVHSPGTFMFYGMTIHQSNDYDIQVSADEKLNSIEPYIPTTIRRKQAHENMTNYEQFVYNSINGSLVFLGMIVSPFAAFSASFLQQKRSNPVVSHLSLQSTVLRNVKRLGSTCSFHRPHGKGKFDVSVLVFADAARPHEHGQIGFIAGLLIGTFERNSVFHTLTWQSHLSKRPVKSIASAEVLAASEAIEEGKLLSNAYSSLLGIAVPLQIGVDSKDLFDSLTTCRVPEDKSIRGDLELIRYNFETHKVNRIFWIPGSLNLADPLTKRDSPLADSLQLLMFDGALPFQFEKSISRDSDRSTG